MSKLIDERPRAFSKYSNRDDEVNARIAKNIVELLGDDLTSVASLENSDKFAILNEHGTARNLDRIRLEDSIYASQDEDSLLDLISLF